LYHYIDGTANGELHVWVREKYIGNIKQGRKSNRMGVFLLIMKSMQQRQN